MSERFFWPATVPDGELTLEGPEAHHLLHVMRARPGTEVSLFDGRGSEYMARVVSVERRAVRLAVGGQTSLDREPLVRVYVGVAMPKGDRQKFLVEKLVELGTHCLVPLITKRSIVKPSDKTLDRLRRGVIEASKQCGRNLLMEVSPAEELAQFLRRDQAAVRWLAHAGGEKLQHRIDLQSTRAEVLLAVGPEGGFSDEEVKLADQLGWRCVSLGPRMLRIETAALALVGHWTVGRG